MDITNGIKINNKTLNNNNMFKFVTVIDFNVDEDYLYFPMRLTAENEDVLFRRYVQLGKLKQEFEFLDNAYDIYEQVVSQTPRSVDTNNAWNDDKTEGKTELIVWFKTSSEGFSDWFFGKGRTQLQWYYKGQKGYKRYLTEPMLNYLINILYFYDNLGKGNFEDRTYIPVDENLFDRVPSEFVGTLRRNFLYFVKPFGTDYFSSFQFTQNARSKDIGNLHTKPIVHSYYPDGKIDQTSLPPNEKAYANSFRLYVYDTSSSSSSSTENYAPPNINLSYFPILNNYDYGAIHYFNPNIDYATTHNDFVIANGRNDPSKIKGDLVTKREVLKNKLKVFNSQELPMRIAGAVSLSGRLQWFAKGYKYQDDTKYSNLQYEDKEGFLRVSNINFDLFKSAMPVQIHTPPTREFHRTSSYQSGFPDEYKYNPPIFFRVKDSHTLDVIFTHVEPKEAHLPFVLTTSASHIFFIDVSIIDDILNNHQNTFSHSIPLHLQK